ncbi:MAG: protein kinase domain-containing protein, partial [Nannocystaceae bacterium]
RGHDLHTELEKGPLPWRRAVSLACQVASALHAAHERQIIHRDIKPGNIFLIPDKRREKVKLLDFGVATVHDAERREESLTPAGCAVGTVNYIPPDLVLGKRADKRSDIYSFGVTLYKMVTGQLPFRSEAVGPARDHQIMQMHVQQEPEPPRRLNSEIPPQLDAIILRCMQKKPAKRFQSADLLADTLEDLLAGDPGRQTVRWKRGSSKPFGQKVPATPIRQKKRGKGGAAVPPTPARLPSSSYPPIPPTVELHQSSGSQASEHVDTSKSSEEGTSEHRGRDATLPEESNEERVEVEPLEATARVLFRTTVGFTTVSIFVAACMFFTIVPVTGAWARAIIQALQPRGSIGGGRDATTIIVIEVTDGDSDSSSTSEEWTTGTTGEIEPEEGDDEGEVDETSEKPSGGTPNPEPPIIPPRTPTEPPTEDIKLISPEKELRRRIRAMRKCRDQLPFKNIEKVVVQVSFDESGRVTSASVSGTDGPADSCIEAKLKKLKLRVSEPPASGKIRNLEVTI